MTKRTCKNCIYFEITQYKREDGTAAVGECRYSAPIPDYNEGYEFRGVWVLVDDFEWCGNGLFKDAQPGQTQNIQLIDITGNRKAFLQSPRA